MALTEKRIDEIFDSSELVYQVGKHFDGESAEMMVDELKTKLKNELRND